MEDLIKRLEEATGPSYQLDCDIHVAACGSGDGPYKPYASRDAWLIASQGRIPPYTASLDAALALVPEGWRAGFEDGGKYDGVILPEAWCWPFESSFEPDWQSGHEGYRSAPDGHKASAKTRSLALCIAALRAHKRG